MSLIRLVVKFIKYFLIAKRNNWNYQLLFACDIYIYRNSCNDQNGSSSWYSYERSSETER